MDRGEQLKVFARCLGEPIYAIENFLKTFDLTQEGMVPFNTFRALIDYSYATAVTINGSFGIKFWVCYKQIC